jgi:large subunit ribosomal protein L4e
MSGRPIVSVFDYTTANTVAGQVKLPAVFAAPLRQDIVSFVHDNLSKNSRQARGINYLAGMKHAALSWGTGRAVARIPRIRGSGTSRSGQGANGNMCRAGRMFAPLRVWRKWHRKVNLRQRRHALAAAISSTAVTPLVQARGHHVDSIPQLPLVFANTINNISQTKEAVAALNKYGVGADIERVIDAKALRAGKGKLRNRRFKNRRGPLVIGDDNSKGLARAVQNIAGVDFINVNRLNIRLLAPGGHIGRLCIWTQGALQVIFIKKNKTNISRLSTITSEDSPGKLREEDTSISRTAFFPMPTLPRSSTPTRSRLPLSQPSNNHRDQEPPRSIHSRTSP